MGILGDHSKLNIAGDETCMPTQASPYGKKIVIANLNLRSIVIVIVIERFIAPSATRGWDSFNEHYYYGHTYHDLLPVIVFIAVHL